jgi:hypothetical protein
MSKLHHAPLAVEAVRELAMSALPDAPVVAERPRASRRRRRGSWRPRFALPLRRLPEPREAVKP